MRLMQFNGTALSLMVLSATAAAQTSPSMIPTVVAEAMSLEPMMFGRPKFFDGRVPTSWPSGLVPAGATIVGGGIVGDSTMFRMQVAVFSFPNRAEATSSLRALLTQGGFVPHDVTPMQGVGGFLESEGSLSPVGYCRASTFATFAVVDSARAPGVVAVHLIDGEGGRQSCSPQRDPTSVTPPITIPTLVPPSGVSALGSGSSWSGGSGDTEATLLTSLPADAIAQHYIPQLVKGGWTAQGKPVFSEGVAVQRFSFREKQETWAVVMVVLAVGDRRSVRLQFAKVE